MLKLLSPKKKKRGGGGKHKRRKKTEEASSHAFSYRDVNLEDSTDVSKPEPASTFPLSFWSLPTPLNTDEG